MNTILTYLAILAILSLSQNFVHGDSSLVESDDERSSVGENDMEGELELSDDFQSHAKSPVNQMESDVVGESQPKSDGVEPVANPVESTVVTSPENVDKSPSIGKEAEHEHRNSNENAKFVEQKLEEKLRQANEMISSIVKSTRITAEDYFTTRNGQLKSIFGELEQKISDESKLVFEQLDKMTSQSNEVLNNLKKHSNDIIAKSFDDMMGEVNAYIGKVVGKLQTASRQIKESLASDGQNEAKLNSMIVDSPNLIIETIKRDNEKIKNLASHFNNDQFFASIAASTAAEAFEEPAKSETATGDDQFDLEQNADFFAKNLVDAIQTKLQTYLKHNAANRVNKLETSVKFPENAEQEANSFDAEKDNFFSAAKKLSSVHPKVHVLNHHQPRHPKLSSSHSKSLLPSMVHKKSHFRRKILQNKPPKPAHF